LPSVEGQAALLERAYREAELDADALSFFEAHGTGTVVGDPVEAMAVGRVLGRRRSAPLPIGSVKSNIGHLEPASGVAGMMKALIALEQRRLPATLHLEDLNPLIKFAELNLVPAAEPIDLGRDGTLHCGVSSFGFGGTNAHVVMSGAPRQTLEPLPDESTAPNVLVLSAACHDALREVAASHGKLLQQGVAPARLANAVARGRQRMRHRAVLPLTDGFSMAKALEAFAECKPVAGLAAGLAPPRPVKMAFAFSGNGAQWVGMGRHACVSSADFATAFDDVDAAFRMAGLEPMAPMLFADDLAERLGSAACAQPLLFAIQVALARALERRGVVPDMVVGHSVGELAAAHVAGLIDLETAARVLTARARSQEAVRGEGAMAVLAANRAAVAALIAKFGETSLQIAADNSDASVTVSGTVTAISGLLKAARKERIAGRKLDIDYPYHSSLLDRIEGDFRAAVGRPGARAGIIPMISTVTGVKIADPATLDADYWWSNIRSEVQFRTAITACAEAGCGLIVEIGPQPILTAAISAAVEEAVQTATVLPSLSDRDEDAARGGDPEGDIVELIAARLIAHGRDAEGADSRGHWVDRSLHLPPYPWQRRTFRCEPTSAAIDIAAARPRHPLLGSRLAEGVPEWRSVIDPERVPFLADHVVGGEVVMPATALAEMALAAAHELAPGEPAAIRDFDIVQAMIVPEGTQREVSVQYSTTTGTIEIYHRPRFGADEWLLCARGQIVPAPAADYPPEAGSTKVVEDLDQVYETALATGLDYGPSFKLVERIWSGDDVMMGAALAAPVDAGPTSHPERFVLHPASLDCAMHGLIDRLVLGESGQTVWVPIRFERLTVWRPGAIVRGAALRMLRDAPMSKVIDIWLTDAEGKVVARLDRALLRPLRLQHADDRSAYHHLGEVASVGPQPDEALRDALAGVLEGLAIAGQSEARLLLRAHMWASLRRELAGIADDTGLVTSDALALLNDKSLDAARLRVVLADLRSAGVLSEDSKGLRIVANADLDDPDAILLSFAQDFPTAVSDLVLSAHAAGSLRAFLAGEAVTAPRTAVVERHRGRGLLVAPLRDAIETLRRGLSEALAERPLHVAVRAGFGEMLLPELIEAAQTGVMRLSVLVAGATESEAVHRRMPELADIRCVDLLDSVLPSDVDLAIALCDERSETIDVAAVAALLRADGILAIGEVQPDALAAFQTGATADVGAGDHLAAIRGSLAAAGLREREVLRGESGECALVVASARADRAKDNAPQIAITALAEGEALAVALSSLVAENEANTAVTGDEIAGEVIVVDGKAKGAADIADAVLALRELLVSGRAAEVRHRLWIVCPPSAAEPLRDALGAFARVAMNEFPERDLRWIACDPALSPQAGAAAIAAHLARPGDERFVTFGCDGSRLVRLRDGLPAGGTVSEAGRALELEFPRPGILERFEWQDAPREAPDPDEIEIEVVGSALNFRDMMLAMGLLNDDVVDEGMTGPVLGFECVGRVIATGVNVKRHRIGDVVVGFGRHSFSTHVRAHEDFFFTLPQGLSAEASAAIPVAFLTAWYALVECARMRPGETVLIHGGAGGVGLAAIQIAKAAGCEVIATVSSEDKRAVARLFGADHLLNSRSLDFADEVQARFGGVDIVLNSLFGEAMRASLRCLRPRGRFIELGKRDYVTNTAIGVRPFRRNLAYFGVDVDQVLAEDPAFAARGMGEILAGFEDGQFLPLPCSVFDATEVNHAFRTMQAAAHVGKIVVRPPSLERPAARTLDSFAPGDKVQLVVGGTRGFGLATALWLADHGATKIVVASRAGVIDQSFTARVDSLRKEGRLFEVEKVDVANAKDVTALIRRVTANHGPIGGVYHTAAILDDGLIDDLDPPTLMRVFKPKIDGARHLDTATRNQPLDRFVLFSSVSALFGNPGQAAYCAANGYLEGLARCRRAEGLPALAVQWGAIADVGMLADRQDTMRSLERVSGVSAMQSGAALNRLGRLLAVADALPDPVIACADFVADSAAAALPVLASPSFAGALFSVPGAVGERSQDLAEMIVGKSDVEAQRLIADILAGEVAQILRLPVADIDQDGSIDSLGMDSLMALELRMSIESRYRIELPVMAISSGTNIRALAHRLLRTLRDAGSGAEEGGLSATEVGLLAMHGGESRPDDLGVRSAGAGS
jgi:acyl transferase domain-containing protein/NADPH:quinone reductase-like Zn-dependent oxidoreductase/acyl carrier protein